MPTLRLGFTLRVVLSSVPRGLISPFKPPRRQFQCRLKFSLLFPTRGLRRIRGTFFGGPHDKGYCILGPTLGSSVFNKLLHPCHRLGCRLHRRSSPLRRWRLTYISAALAILLSTTYKISQNQQKMSTSGASFSKLHSFAH